ncbi:putative Rho-type GTPase-activating protein 2 [Psilocybe cubensis]|uniref:RhoGAP-domain-containing protein n=2 Tax=Psilocybe cubensis TaxID=181762 RepID=A0A8H7XVW1_PSICU|nr:putative Rho-type GTPase-activating protein 2 [Psilocybe cubensis]KAH9479619.1 putative Rho-type GTPase-activating protein 2 [Psilocybe cubensis]
MTTATPSRDRHPFPQSAHPSPGPSQRNPSAPSPSPSVAQSSPQPITSDALLKQFAASPDPKTAALDQAVADRNVLSAQNAQLWKLIEKQRTGYNQILKELERIRAERDTYKVRLISLTGTASSSSDKRTKSTSERDRPRPSLDAAPTQAQSASKGAAPRHNSEDSANRAIAHPHALQPSRSFDPTRQNTTDIETHPILTSTRTSSPQPGPPPSSAPSLTTRQHSRPNPSPLVVPTRADTLPASYTVSDSPDSSTSQRLPNPYDSATAATPTANGSSSYPQIRPLVPPRKSSIADSISSVVTSGSSAPSVAASIAASSPSTSILSNLNNSYTSAAERDPTTPSQQQYSSNSTSVSVSAPANGESAFSRQRQQPGNPTPQPPAAQAATNMLSPEPRPHFLSRDSRISLPDEARQYIASMSDSPAASPRAEAFSPRSKLSNSVFPPSNSQNPGESEFLDMDEEDDDDDDGNEDDEDRRLGEEDEDDDGQGDITAGAHDPTFNGLRAAAPPTTINKSNNTDLSQAGYQYPPTNYNNNHNNTHTNNNYPPSQTSYTTSELQQQHQQRLKDQQQQQLQQQQRDKQSRAGPGGEEFQFPLPPAAAPPTANNPIYLQRQQALAAQQELQAQAQAHAQSLGYTQQQMAATMQQQAPSATPMSAKHAQAPAEQVHHPGSMSGNYDSQIQSAQMQTQDAAYLGGQGQGYPTNRSESSFQSQGSQSQSQTQSQQPQPDREREPIQAVPTTSFRALPLLSSDLPHTTITVSHSFVRPNDRGKEVLSFIVFVNPGNGKEGWKVEKMYSDVLSLDSRVRNSVGKGVGKKIATLPEGKLWKDHAPAKVDQRKAVLENYLQTLIQLPVKNNDEVIAFFTSDIVREQKQPVMQAGHKEGYLTKRGKNFGGWKTRYFVLQGPVLEYYDCRGGAHLGSINIAGAQIARQHRTEKPPSTDDEKEYRHAFLIVEMKKGPGGNHPRHVLCAESDEDRDSWVEMLVRYYTGVYSDDLVFNPTSGLTSVQSNSVAASQSSMGVGMSQPRSSSSSSSDLSTTAVQQQQQRSNTGGKAIPISVLPPGSVPNPDDYMMRSSSPSRSVDPSPIDGQGPSFAGNGARVLERSNLGLPSSLPDSSPLSSAVQGGPSSGTSFPDGSSQAQMQQAQVQPQRANSELGHYPDLQDARHGQKGNQRQHSPEQHRARTNDDMGVGVGRKNFYPSLTTVAPSPTAATHGASGPPPDRVPSPEKQQQQQQQQQQTQERDANASKVKISGPMNGAPIPSGFKFGGKEPSSADPATAASANDRREKTKSRFWGFGKVNGDKSNLHTAYPPRAVFGVPLEEALDVAQMCNLPAIVFRSIQYLEAKKADQEEGIYRLSGSSAEIKNLKDRFNNEGDVDLLASDQYWDPHAIAGLLKSFLRELPSSILTRDLHLKFLAVIDFVDPQERIKELSQLIAALPLANYSLLRALTAHLILIVQNSNVNKMTMRNVGIVFSPTLGIPAGVFSLMLGEFNRVFNVDADNDDLGEKEGEALDNPAEPLRRNSRQYTDAAADQVLGLAGRSLTAADEAQSDGDDFSIQDESGTETTEGDNIVESSSSSSPVSNAERDHGIRISEPDTPTAKTSKASSTAASRGLNVAVTHSDRGHRHSRMMGLPLSPRPGATAHTSPSRQEQPVNSSPTPGWPNEQMR